MTVLLKVKWRYCINLSIFLIKGWWSSIIDLLLIITAITEITASSNWGVSLVDSWIFLLHIVKLFFFFFKTIIIVLLVYRYAFFKFIVIILFLISWLIIVSHFNIIIFLWVFIDFWMFQYNLIIQIGKYMIPSIFIFNSYKLNMISIAWLRV